MAPIHLLINNSPHDVEIAPDTPLLWVLRDKLNLTGTEYGCGMGLCGACTVHLDGDARLQQEKPVAQGNALEGQDVRCLLSSTLRGAELE